MSSLTSAFKKANGYFLGALGLAGITGWGFYLNATAEAGSALGGFGVFYGDLFNAISGGAVEGAGIVLSDIFSLATDTIIPGAGIILSAITHSL